MMHLIKKVSVMILILSAGGIDLSFAQNEMRNKLQNGVANSDLEKMEHEKYIQQKKVSSEFSDLCIRITPIYNAAVAHGISVPQHEINTFTQILKEAFPDSRFNHDDAERALIAARYAKEQRIIGNISEIDIRNIYESYKKECQKNTVMNLERIRPLFECFIVLSNKEVDKKLQRFDEQETMKWVQQVKKFDQTWPSEKLYLPGNGDDCIAYTGDSCIVSLSQYNEAVPFIRISMKISKDSIIINAVQEILKTIRKAQLATACGYTDNSDCKEMAAELLKTLALKRGYGNVSFIGNPSSIDEHVLLTTYARHYNEYFKERETIKYGLIGSSDSLYLDSLHALRNTIGNQKDGKETKSKINSKMQTELPWSLMVHENLPTDLLGMLDTIQFENSITKPIKTPYGFFIFKIMEKRYHERIPFQDAIEKLTLLSMKDKLEDGMDTVENKELKHYTENKGKYLTADTCLLRMWLTPYPGDEKKRKGKRIHSNQPVHQTSGWHDTARFRPLTVSSINLPKSLYTSISSKCNAPEMDSCIGPIKSIYGIHYFKLQYLRRGGKQLPFHEVRAEIQEELQINATKIAQEIARDKNNWYLSLLAIAMAYDNHRYASYKKTDENKINDFITKGEITIDSVFQKKFKKENSKSSYYRIVNDVFFVPYQINLFNNSIDEWISRIHIAI
ncbi:MAG: hypothetical protein JW795_05500 [Chitinivibrionales bacterium]|nr:hypothetical protein [Chitinivibrionales bacterium]